MIAKMIARGIAVGLATGLFWGMLANIAMATNAESDLQVGITVTLGIISTVAAYCLLIPSKES